MACSANYTTTTLIPLVLLVLIIASSSVPLSTYCSTTSIVNNNKTAADDKFQEEPPKPTPWPVQFHSRMVMHTNTSYEVTDLWYDWPKGRNINYIQYQLGSLLYNQEWTNGTSFLYTIDQDPPAPLDQPCTVFQFEVGILRPNFMEGATYLGQREADGFLCNVWEKVDYFITYYEDVVSKRPVYWILYTGKKTHVMTWEVGAVLEDAECQTPAFCFDQNGNAKSPSLGAPPNFDFERISPLPIRRSSSYM